MLEAIKKFLSEQTDTTVEVLRRLIQTRTVNPPGDEYRAAEVLRPILESAKIPYETFEKQKGRVNLVARIGPAGGGRILVPCHSDTVPAGQGWHTDPFKAVVKDGRIFGRGAKDNKGPLAAMLTVARFLKLRETELAGEFVFLATADEETGSELGMKYLVEECGLEADAAIVPDAGYNMAQISVGEKGAIFLRLIAHGRQAHGSTPEVGVSAAWAIIEVLNRLKKEKLPHEAVKLFSPPTMNLGVLAGGAAPNMVPAECEAQLDFRYLPGTSSKEIISMIQRHADDVKRGMSGAEFELSVMADQLPTVVDPNHAMVRIIQDCTEAVTGRRPAVVGNSGATVTKPLVLRGIPAVGFTFGDENIEHQANESIAIAEVMDFAAVMALVLWDLIGPDAKGGI